MPDPRTTPESIGPTAGGTRLAIVWGDGEMAEYEPRALRLRCPCAGCVDEMTGIRTLRPESVPETIHPVSIHYVGRYALQFVWSDGHDTGFFTFDQLRRMHDGESA
ncbi:MAG: DUF971 domain-containing protein [Gemmatimonadota bacterium]|nr:DUF971 domain-containing protein [Gemmatimonadota bacterium]